MEISKYISDENKASKSVTILQLTDHLLTYLLEGLEPASDTSHSGAVLMFVSYYIGRHPVHCPEPLY